MDHGQCTVPRILLSATDITKTVAFWQRYIAVSTFCLPIVEMGYSLRSRSFV